MSKQKIQWNYQQRLKMQRCSSFRICPIWYCSRWYAEDLRDESLKILMEIDLMDCPGGLSVGEPKEETKILAFMADKLPKDNQDILWELGNLKILLRQ